MTLRLPPARLGLEPGSIVQPGLMPALWIVDKATIDGFVTVVELRPSWQPSAALAADAGRIVASSDIVEAATVIGLFEAPSIGDVQASAPTLLIAASSANAAWNLRPLTVSSSGQSFLTQAPARKSLLGRALTVLGDAAPDLIDDRNSVDVELVDAQQWITSCDDDALADGANLAVIGSELVQFGQVTALGDGQFRIAHLLRGRGGTEWASGGHSAGEMFCLLDSNALRPLSLPIWMRGSTVSAVDRNGSSASLTFGAESVRPLAPANLAAELGAGGELTLSWTRRSRSGFAWVDEIDAPLGESREQYGVIINGTASSLELSAAEPLLVVAASDLAAIGGRTASIEVRQIGDWAASRPAQLTIELP